MAGRMTPRLQSLLEFSALADRLKHVHRAGRTCPPTGTGDPGAPRAADRPENAAEHCWHVALLALLLHQEVATPVDIGKALSMIIVHDLVEIIAGDTFAHDQAGTVGQAAREAAAADQLFGTLPAQLGADLRGLWEDFEAQSSTEARFAMGCDRLQGFAQQIGCGAPAWLAAGVTETRSHRRMNPAREVDPVFATLIDALHDRAQAAGLFTPEPFLNSAPTAWAPLA
jgi:putative hydrolase of HD superfamily